MSAVEPRKKVFSLTSLLWELSKVLVIPIVTGVLVWQITKPEQDSKSIIYTFEKVGYFNKNGGNKHIYLLRIINDSKKPFFGITSDVKFGAQSSIIDYSAIGSATAPEIGTLSAENGVFRGQITKLLPTEGVDFFIETISKSNQKPKIVVKTNESVVNERVVDTERSALTSPIMLFLILILYAIFVAIVAMRLPKHIMPVFRQFLKNKNDSGFLMLHAGFIAEAESIFKEAIAGGNLSAYARSNLALALFFGGKPDEAKRLNDSALEWAASGHEHDLVLFNRSIMSGDASEISRLTSKSKKLDEYARKSHLVQTSFPDLKNSGKNSGDSILNSQLARQP